jgi:hypothetical protein
MNEQTPGPWFTMRSCATGVYTLGRYIPAPKESGWDRLLETMQTPTGRERTFKTETAAVAAIAKTLSPTPSKDE